MSETLGYTPPEEESDNSANITGDLPAGFTSPTLEEAEALLEISEAQFRLDIEKLEREIKHWDPGLAGEIVKTSTTTDGPGRYVPTLVEARNAVYELERELEMKAYESQRKMPAYDPEIDNRPMDL